MAEQQLFDQLLKKRGLLTATERRRFLKADYSEVVDQDPFLLPDMRKAVRRLVRAHSRQEKVLIYGDYDADGITATALLVEGLRWFGFKNVEYSLPDRFTEGYGLNSQKLQQLIKQHDLDLIITVDCGSLDYNEVKLATELGVDVIITDHHNLSDKLPPALAVVNPRRSYSRFPIKNMAGVAVAFNLVLALKTELPGLRVGQEKWLLDLVAIGTVTDLISLIGYNRVLVKYGLVVLAKNRRPGLRLLMKEAKIDSKQIDSDTIGFILGPRFNAAGRLESAELALGVLLADNQAEAKEAVDRLEFLNQKRRALQDKIFNEVDQLAAKDQNPVLVLKQANWHEGVVGIVASKIMEAHQKPVFVLSKKDDELKGSARSFGDFSVFKAIEASRRWLSGGGGHDMAGGVSLLAKNFSNFRQAVNDYYRSLKLTDQKRFLQINPDVTIKDFESLTIKFYRLIQQMAPFGEGNPEPIFDLRNVKVERLWRMGKNRQHLKIKLRDSAGRHLTVVLFSNGQDYQIESGDVVDVMIKLKLNTWQGKSDVEGRLLRLEKHCLK